MNEKQSNLDTPDHKWVIDSQDGIFKKKKKKKKASQALFQ